MSGAKQSHTHSPRELTICTKRYTKHFYNQRLGGIFSLFSVKKKNQTNFIPLKNILSPKLQQNKVSHLALPTVLGTVVWRLNIQLFTTPGP